MAAETHKHFGCESLHNSKMGKTQVRGHVGNGMAKRCPASQSPGVVRQDTRLHQHPPKPSLKLYLTNANKLALPNLSDSSVTRSNPRTPIRNTCKPLARSTEDELQTLCAATAVEPVPWNVLLSSVYRKYGTFACAGCCVCFWLSTSLKILKLRSSLSPSVRMHASLPQR